MTGHVYLVGAGCGGPELITLYGLELLKDCQAVVYDDLIARELADAAPPEAERVPVGKRAGRPSLSQGEINALLIALASEGKRVVRLKGGDPFVFGRGGEEAMALAEAGIPYTLVPGVSSALAIAMEAGIPVTHRAVSRSVHIVTARTAERTLPDGLPRLAALDGTLVFLMGLGALPELAAELVRAGKSPGTPAAVVSGGNAPRPMAVRGTLADIAARVRDAGVLPPAVIVVGPTAALDLRSPAGRAAVQVGLTGSDAFQKRLIPLLRREGLRPCRIQRAQIRTLAASIPWTRLEGGAADTWLAFTSRTGVDVFFRRLSGEGRDVRNLYGRRFAVIGRATGDALAERGVRADLCPAVYTGRALADALAERHPGAVFLFDSDKGSGVVDGVLSTRGLACERISLYSMDYQTLEPSAPVRYLLLGSAGAVHALADGGYELGDTVPVCIGPVCAAAAERRFRRKPLTAEEITAQSLVRAVTDHLRDTVPPYG